MIHDKKIVPVGATWEGTDPRTDRIYRIWLAERRDGFDVWRWERVYPDGSRGSDDSDWGTSYESCRRQMYLDGSGIKLKRVQ